MLTCSIPYTKNHMAEEFKIVSGLKELFCTYVMWEYEDNLYEWQCILDDYYIRVVIYKEGNRKFRVVTRDFTAMGIILDEKYPTLAKCIKQTKTIVTALKLLKD